MQYLDTSNNLEKKLINNISIVLLELDFKSNNTIKLKAIKKLSDYK